ARGLRGVRHARPAADRPGQRDGRERVQAVACTGHRPAVATAGRCCDPDLLTPSEGAAVKIPDPPVGAKRCWFCGDVPQKPGFIRCDACDRQKVRVGVTPCCGVLPLTPGPGEKRYCPACPGKPEDNRVPVVL